MAEPQVYLVFNQLINGQVEAEPTIVHGGLVADFGEVAAVPGMGTLDLTPEHDIRFLVSYAQMPAHNEMMALLRSEVPEGQSVPIMVVPTREGGSFTVYADGQSVEQPLASSVKLSGLQLQGHGIVRIVPYSHRHGAK